MKDNKTVAPVGSWSGWYCSEELKLALTYGYSIKVYKAYHWYDKANIFKGYVDTLYNNRVKYPKGNAKNMISKLLMNSLYGRFGMSPILENHKIVNSEESNLEFWIEHFGSSLIVTDQIEVVGKEQAHNSMLTFKRNSEEKKSRSLININTPLAIFTTAYARMFMAKYKIDYKDNLYYSDTDSLVLDCPLPEELVGTGLGQFKLEYKAKEGIFLAPKVYALKLEGDTDIIKIKGSKAKISYSQFTELLHKDSSYKLNQDKWMKDRTSSNIHILNTNYTVGITEGKRISIYNNNIAMDTMPIVIKD